MYLFSHILFKKAALYRTVFFIVLLLIVGCKGFLDPVPVATSPDEKTVVSMQVRDGIPYFKVDRNNQDILLLSSIALFSEKTSLLENVRWGTITPSFTREAWQESPGSENYIQDVYNEMAVDIIGAVSEQLLTVIRFRCYNDGIAYRLEISDSLTSTFTEKTKLTLPEIKLDSHTVTEFKFETLNGWHVQWHKVSNDTLRYESELGTQTKRVLALQQPFKLSEIDGYELLVDKWNVIHINDREVNVSDSNLFLNLIRK